MTYISSITDINGNRYDIKGKLAEAVVCAETTAFDGNVVDVSAPNFSGIQAGTVILLHHSFLLNNDIEPGQSLRINNSTPLFTVGERIQAGATCFLVSTDGQNLFVPLAISPDNALSATSRNPVENRVIYDALQGKQETLESGVNIKSINGQSILGSGDLETSNRVFLATAEYTPLAELQEAYQNNDIIVVSGYYALSVIDNDTYMDITVQSGRHIFDYRVTEAGWTKTTDFVLLTEEQEDTLITTNNLGSNIKTINYEPLVGSGNINVLQMRGDNTLEQKSLEIDGDDATIQFISESADTVNIDWTDKIEHFSIDVPSVGYVDTAVAAAGVPAIQTSGDWKYRIYNDGTFEAWYNQTKYSITITDTSGNLYRSGLTDLTLPGVLYNAYDCTILDATINCSHSNYPTWGMLAAINATGIKFYALSGGSRGNSPNYTLTAHIFGTLVAK